MPDIQDPRPAEDLRQEFRVTQPFGVSLASVIQPVALVRDLTERVVATGFPRRARGTIAIAAGGAGTNAQAIFSGRVGEGMLFNLLGIDIIRNTSAGSVAIRFGNGDDRASGVEQVTKGYTDQRVSQVLPRAFLAGSTPLTAAVEGTEVASINVEVVGGIAVVQHVDINAVVSELDFVIVSQNTTNESMIVNYEWLEYLLADR